MTNSRISYRAIVSVGAVILIWAAGCAGHSQTASSPAAPSTGPTAAQSVPSSSGSSSPFVLVDALAAAIQDEYHAEAVYQRVLLDFGTVNPFANIIRAEQMHAASLAGLFRSRSLDVPASEWNVDNVPRFASVREACAAAAQAEIDNVAVYDRYLGQDLPADVYQVFTNNRAASLNNHLPAFNRCK
jgi:hypothetical protein